MLPSPLLYIRSCTTYQTHQAIPLHPMSRGTGATHPPSGTFYKSPLVKSQGLVWALSEAVIALPFSFYAFYFNAIQPRHKMEYLFSVFATRCLELQFHRVTSEDSVGGFSFHGLATKSTVSVKSYS